jgi:hypothetical protein
MKPADFCIGLEFICGPFWYRCTDIGARTVTAIKLVEDDPIWYEGPPYMIREVVLDEAKLENAFLSEKEAIEASIDDTRNAGHPGYDHNDVCRMMDDKMGDNHYPRSRRLLEFDRVRADGEILHPYAARRVDPQGHSAWIICLFLPFTKEWIEIEEMVFLGLPLSTPVAVRARAATTHGSLPG